jgi:hypothetical protein
MRKSSCDRLCMGAATVWLTLGGCVTEPVPQVCPELAPGDVVIDEINQAYAENLIPTPGFVELANVSGAPISSFGLRLRMRSVGASTDALMIVRDTTEIPDGGHFVLGFNEPDMAWPGIDFGIGADYLQERVLSEGLLPTGLLTLEVCDVELDEVIYDALPADGSWSLGVTPPDADANDDPDNWCADEVVPPFGSLRGTPGEANRPCD